MPIRMPRAEDIRRRLAEMAARASGRKIEHFLSLLGPVEVVGRPSRDRAIAWRLSSYHGSTIDIEEIDRAIAVVQRTFPFIDTD